MRQNLLQWHKVGDNWRAGAYFVEKVWAPGGKHAWYVTYEPATGSTWDGGTFTQLNGLAGAKYAALRHARQQEVRNT